MRRACPARPLSFDGNIDVFVLGKSLACPLVSSSDEQNSPAPPLGVRIAPRPFFIAIGPAEWYTLFVGGNRHSPALSCHLMTRASVFFSLSTKSQFARPFVSSFDEKNCAEELCFLSVEIGRTPAGSYHWTRAQWRSCRAQRHSCPRKWLSGPLTCRRDLFKPASIPSHPIPPLSPQWPLLR